MSNTSWTIVLVGVIAILAMFFLGSPWGEYLLNLLAPSSDQPGMLDPLIGRWKPVTLP